jgi:hypothetical protein
LLALLGWTISPSDGRISVEVQAQRVIVAGARGLREGRRMDAPRHAIIQLRSGIAVTASTRQTEDSDAVVSWVLLMLTHDRVRQGSGRNWLRGLALPMGRPIELIGHWC